MSSKSKLQMGADELAELVESFKDGTIDNCELDTPEAKASFILPKP